MSVFKRLVIAVALLVLLSGGVLYAKRDYLLAGAHGYLFGYPLVIMDVTRANFLATRGPENFPQRVRQFPDADFREVVRPNVDTLYTIVFFDMSRGPWVFTMPSGEQRYQVFPFMDAWSNVFATLGTRTQSAAGARYLLVAPGWAGAVPAGLELLRAPTSLVWLIGRTQTNGVADYPVVHALQDQVGLVHLDDWLAGKREATPTWSAAAEKPLPPVEQIKAMSTEAFFVRLARLMRDNPAAAGDAPMLEQLARIGVAPGQAPAWSALESGLATLGRRIADWKVKQALSAPRDLKAGWTAPPMNLGAYGTDYPLRAVVAMVGLGANLPADAIYPNSRYDLDGRLLNGTHRYRVHFPAKALPPVNAFWSLTVYDQDDFLVRNPLNRYALGDRDALRYNSDGSLDIYLQAEAPDETLRSNWLPVPANAPFAVTARLYWPKPEALDGRWQMPGIQRLP